MATCHSGYSSVGRASDCRLCRNQMVPGSIPGGRIALLSHPPATSTGSDWTVLFVSLVSCLSVPLSAEGSGGQYFGKCGAGWFRRFLYTNLVELLLSKKRSKSSRPLWGAARIVAACGHMPFWLYRSVGRASDCRLCRNQMVKFSLLNSSWPDCFALVLPPPPQAAIELCCLSALYLACPYRCLQRAREGGQYFGKCGAGWFRRFFYTNLVEFCLTKNML